MRQAKMLSGHISFVVRCKSETAAGTNALLSSLVVSFITPVAKENDKG